MRQTSVAIVVTHARTPTLNSRSRHREAPEASRRDDHARVFVRREGTVAACLAFQLTPRVSFSVRAAGGPLLPPGTSCGGPRLPRGGQVARQGSVRDLMNRVFVVTLVETATNAGIESASRAYQSDDDAVHSITTTIALDTSQTNKRVNRFFLEISKLKMLHATFK